MVDNLIEDGNDFGDPEAFEHPLGHACFLRLRQVKALNATFSFRLHIVSRDGVYHSHFLHQLFAETLLVPELIVAFTREDDQVSALLVFVVILRIHCVDHDSLRQHRELKGLRQCVILAIFDGHRGRRGCFLVHLDCLFLKVVEQVLEVGRGHVICLKLHCCQEIGVGGSSPHDLPLFFLCYWDCVILI